MLLSRALGYEMHYNHPSQIMDEIARLPPGFANGRGLHHVHHPDTQANVITTDFSAWATNCPEYNFTVVQISPSNGPSRWQEEYEQFSRDSRRIAPMEAAE